MTMALLQLDNVMAFYGPIRALNDVSIRIEAGEIVCLLGGNASGKSTTMKTILGMVRAASGTVRFAGERIDRLPTQLIVGRGISLVPEARRLFGRMTVRENLALGTFGRRHRPTAELDADHERVFALFPRVKERLDQYAGTLSGGEQQMVAIGRALMARPKLLLMDEPSMGLAPVFVDQVFDIIRTINQQGTTNSSSSSRMRRWRSASHIAATYCRAGVSSQPIAPPHYYLPMRSAAPISGTEGPKC